MGRHVMTDADREAQRLQAATQQATTTPGAAPGASIAPPPGAPEDPGTPGAPDLPGNPEPSPFPGTPEPGPTGPGPDITPAEPAPYAPDESYDGTTTGQPGMAWKTASQEIIR